MNNDFRFQLFGDYINELQSIKGLKPLSIFELQDSYKSYISDQNLNWIDIFNGDRSGKPIGFLIVGYPPNCHPAANYYIEEAYIAPDYRRQGHMTSVASRFIATHPGTFCLFILNNNNIAFQVWHKLFAHLGYIPCFLADVGAGDQYCEQYGFKKLFC